MCDWDRLHRIHHGPVGDCIVVTIVRLSPLAYSLVDVEELIVSIWMTGMSSGMCIPRATLVSRGSYVPTPSAISGVLITTGWLHHPLIVESTRRKCLRRGDSCNHSFDSARTCTRPGCRKLKVMGA